MPLNPFATMPSSLFYFFLLASICILSIYPASSSSSSTVSYADHCSSIVPQSNLTNRVYKDSIPHLSTSYFTGGDRILGSRTPNHTYVYMIRKSIRLRIGPDYYETKAPGIYRVEGTLFMRFPYSYVDYHSYGGSYYRRSTSRARGRVRFSLNGFWSEISRKLCMVGSAYWDDAVGEAINLDAVLKLSYGSEIDQTIYTGVISGSLESTSPANDPGYFDPTLIFGFPPLYNYEYSLVTKELGGVFSPGLDVPRNQSLSSKPNKFCSLFEYGSTFLELEYAMECTENEHCSPLGNGVGSIGSLPRVLSLNQIQCSEKENKLRYMAKFQNVSNDYQSFSLDSAVVGEASWDDKSNKLFGVACRLLNPSDHFGNAVGDCTMRLSLRFPSIWTIRNDAKIVGQLWSSKAVNDSGYFRRIRFTSSDEKGFVALQGPRYEYTELEKVRKSCSPPVKKANTYPDGHSYDMRFDLNIKNSKGGEQFAWGYAAPVFVGNDLYRGNNVIGEGEVAAVAVESVIEVETVSKPVIRSNTSPINMSYKISINPIHQLNSSDWLTSLNRSINLHRQVEITAEGVYNAEKGYLCMVGCRKLVQNSTTSMDCEILVKFDFPPLSERRSSLIKGTIESTRAKTDPLYFDVLIVQSAAYYGEMAEQSIWRMDLEIVMVLISNMLACIFVALQIFHVKRNHEVPSFISIAMLLILSVGHMIPLVLNFEAMFLGNHEKRTLLLRNGGKLEANEVTVRMISMVAFLLQIRLLQLVWTVKQNDETKKNWWTGEKKTAFVVMPLYILGGLLTMLLNSKRNRYRGYHQKFSLWGDLRSYAGLILDGFLLPQILLNIFRGSAEKALSHPFYIGISVVRLVPHAYNQYRAHNFPKFEVNATYYYANPAADFYSTAWDVTIPCGVVALAVIVFLQQRHGGRCILPQRFRGLELYEKVPTDDNA